MGRSALLAGVGMLVLCLTVGCTKRNPSICCTTEADCDRSGLPSPTPCDDALVCLANTCQRPPTCQADSDCSGSLACDVLDGVCVECIDSSTCGDEVCDPESHRCRACTQDAECLGGYCSTATATCRRSILPSYVPDVCTETSDTNLVVTSDEILDTDDLAACNGGIVSQSGEAPAICVVRYRSIFIQGGSTLTVRGSRAIAIVADTTATIDGTLDLDARAEVDGPGGGVVSGGEPQPSCGGGGAGFGTSGGSGGATVVVGSEPNGGDSVKDPSGGPLLAGRRSAGSEGGGGGGAATIIACRGRASITGVISANGGGARSAAIGFGGAGGGSGGFVAIQGRTVSMTGRAYANGGSGAGGGSITKLGQPGADGQRSSTTCATGFGNGGTGGCLRVAPTDGGEPFKDELLAGGGGGSVGAFVVLSTLEGATVAPSLASPDFIDTGMLETR